MVPPQKCWGSYPVWTACNETCGKYWYYSIDHLGCGCGSVGRAVASNARGPQFKYSHRQKLYWTFTVNCIEKMKIKKKEAGNDPFKKDWLLGNSDARSVLSSQLLRPCCPKWNVSRHQKLHKNQYIYVRIISCRQMTDVYRLTFSCFIILKPLLTFNIIKANL